ncbi:MAG: helix-hairpin-helix domain-containing protein [Pseudomonadota bacterium]
MSPNKVVRARVRRFTDLPNIGPAMARDFELLGFTEPAQLIGADPYELYLALCVATGARQDPCVLDVFMSVTDFLSGGPAAPWWDFTAQRKREYGPALAAAF